MQLRPQGTQLRNEMEKPRPSSLLSYTSLAAAARKLLSH